MSAEWLSVSQPQGRWNRGREAESTETSEVRDEMWGEVRAYVLVFVWNWAEVGFRYKSNGAFYTFFFFFWISADSGPSRPDSARIGLSRSRVGASRLKARGIHVAWRGRTSGQRCPRRIAVSRRVGCGCGTSSAASVLHSWGVLPKPIYPTKQ